MQGAIRECEEEAGVNIALKGVLSVQHSSKKVLQAHDTQRRVRLRRTTRKQRGFSEA